MLEERRRCSAETRGLAVGLLLRPGASGGRLEERRRARRGRRASPVVRDVVRRPRTAARAGRPSSACACRGRSARATSAGRRPRRTGGAAARSRCSRARSGRASAERHHVLELVAEAEGAARLVVAGARPEPAAHVLVEQPAVHQQVEGVVRRAAPGPRRASRPSARRTASSAARPPPTEPWRATSSRACARVRALAEQEHDARASRRARASSATCSAAHGSSPAPKRPRERLAARAPPAARASRCGRGTRGRSPVAERSGLARVREGDAPGELGVVGIAREDRAASRRRARSRRGARWPARGGPEDPLVVGEDAEAPRPRRRRSSSVEHARASPDPRRPRRRRARGGCRARSCAKRVTPARVADDPARRSSASRRSGPGRRRPRPRRVSSSRRKSASAVGSLTGSLANGVRRFSRLLLGPGEGGPGGGDDGAEAGIGDDVHPRQRRLRLALEHDRRTRARRRRSRRARWRSASGGDLERRRRRGSARAARAGASSGGSGSGQCGVGALELRRRGRRARRSAPRAPPPRAGRARPRPCGRRAAGRRRRAGASTPAHGPLSSSAVELRRASRRGSSTGCSFRITTSARSPLSRQYSCACSTWRTSGRSSSSTTRTSRIGRSPEMPCGQRPSWPSALRGQERPGAARSERVGVEHARGQPLEEQRLLARDAEVAQRALRVREGEREGRAPPALGSWYFWASASAVVAVERHAGGEATAARSRPGARRTRWRRLTIGSSTTPVVPESGAPVERLRVVGPAPAAEEARAVGLPLDRPLRAGPRGSGRAPPTAPARRPRAAAAGRGAPCARAGTRSRRTACRRPGGRGRRPAGASTISA